MPEEPPNLEMTETNTQYTGQKNKSIYVNEKPLDLLLKSTERHQSKKRLFANSSIGACLGEEKAGTYVNVTEIKQEPKSDQKQSNTTNIGQDM